MSDPFETVDWQGQQVECEQCTHAAPARPRAVQPRQACVHDRYAKRIERFFAAHRGLALDYLAHPYFEVRAIAAKYVDIFHLSRMRNDPDETVRSMVALRLPQGQLHAMCNDPDREVRIRVAYRLPENELGQMMHDSDYYVRTVVAKRITKSMLTLMIHDPDSSVRMAVAERIDPDMLQAMSGDYDATVRLAVAKRLPKQRLSMFRQDEDWRVRYEVAQRIAALNSCPGWKRYGRNGARSCTVTPAGKERLTRTRREYGKN